VCLYLADVECSFRFIRLLGPDWFHFTPFSGVHGWYDAAMRSGVGKYRLGPFLLESEIAIPELKLQETGAPDAFIRLGKVPEKLENVVANESRWWATRDEYLLRVPGVASFYVSHGRDVVVEPAPDALPGDIRAYLLAPIFSTLCYQAGMYSLHASSVRVGDGVAAFLGHSGAGKSTLAAYLERRGYPVVSDDICLLDPRAEKSGGEAVVVPVAPALKLWRSALEQLGAKPEELPRVFSRDDKYRMKIGEIEDRLPLREVFFLEWAEDSEAPPELIAVEGVHAITKLMEFTHYDYLMKPTGRQADNFQLGGRILSQVRAFRFRRPRNFARIDGVIDALDRHFATGGSKTL
jgi:hypothetical protein